MGNPAEQDPPASLEFENHQPLKQVRWPSAFNPPNGMFAPGEPLWPIIQEPARTYDFRTGLNYVITPRSGELRSFEELRAFANVELVRLAIETRKDQINKLDWQIKPREDRPKARRDAEERIRAATRFFKKPDGVHHFHDWLRLLLEDLFAIDAPCLERRRTRSGNIVGYDIIPGDTIKILVDYNGRIPVPPVPAYQQIIKGRVWCDFTTDDIIYSPRNIRPGHIYGFSPVEQIIVTINTTMLRQASQLAYFSDGTVPAGLATVPDAWSTDQIKDWQEWMDEKFSGNLAERRKLLWGPAGTGYQAFKEAPIKDEFDEWLARVVCYSFSLPPTPFIKQLNRSASQADQERAIDEGQMPLKMWCKRFIDEILQVDLKYTDLEFDWIREQDIDPAIEATVNTTYLKTGVMLINEVRDSLGRDPIKGGDEPLIYTSQGALKLEDVLDPPILPDAQVAGGAKIPQASTALRANNPSNTSSSSSDDTSKSSHALPVGFEQSTEKKALIGECLGIIDSLTKGSRYDSPSLSGR